MISNPWSHAYECLSHNANSKVAHGDLMVCHSTEGIQLCLDVQNNCDRG